MNSAAFSSNVLCPRCGYDQRGVMATWTEKGSCPLEGTCAECGLAFDWIDVINPGRMKPMWCVEYARGRWSMVLSIVKTAALQVLPWMFWRRVAMHHEPRFGRIILYVLVLLVTLYPALMIGQGKAAWQHYHGWRWPVPPPVNPTPTISDWQAIGWSMLLPFSATSPGGYLLAVPDG